MSVLVVLILIRVGPQIEGWASPCAEGLAIDWHVADDGEIRIPWAQIWKSEVCEYKGINARAGQDDLRIETGVRFGNRPGGIFFLRNARIQAPPRPGPVIVTISVRHRWNPLWESRSRLFRIDYPGRPGAG